MRRILPAPLLGVVTMSMLVINLTFWGTVFFFAALPKLLPIGRIKKRVAQTLQRVVELWAKGNNVVLDSLLDFQWIVDGFEGLRADGRYVVIANHRSWLDIPVIQRALVGRISFFKFFIKRQLIWAPIVGQAAWALDFPFMKRHPKEKLAKHPELRGEDLETTKRSLRFFGKEPESILNFMEGTRFTEEKHEIQSSPWRHLLKPKSGGVAYVLGAVGYKLDGIVDATIVYPPGKGKIFWRFIKGKLPWIYVNVRRRDIPVEYASEASWSDPTTRRAFQKWIREVWTEKDALIDDVLRRQDFVLGDRSAGAAA